MITRSTPRQRSISAATTRSPSTATESMDKFLGHHNGTAVAEEFHYSSDNNEEFLSVSEISGLIQSENL